ncbi:MAG: class I SAM-dependent methyltransferase [Myxococcota bacterium]
MIKPDYESVASEYEKARSIPDSGLGDWRVALAPHCSASTHVLDVGAGTGVWSELFHEWFAARVSAIDPSSEMLRIARKLRSRDSIDYTRSTADEIPLGTGQCEVAWLSTVVHHFPDLDTAAQEISRVLTPDATVLVRSSFPTRHDKISLFAFFPEASDVASNFPTVEAVVAAFSPFGFEMKELRSVAQTSASSLRDYRGNLVKRADTTLRSISDEAFERGVHRLDEAVAKSPDTPVVDSLDLLVLRRTSAPGLSD